MLMYAFENLHVTHAREVVHYERHIFEHDDERFYVKSGSPVQIVRGNVSARSCEAAEYFDALHRKATAVGNLHANMPGAANDPAVRWTRAQCDMICQELQYMERLLDAEAV